MKNYSIVAILLVFIIFHLCIVNNWKSQQVVFPQQQVWQALEAIRASPAVLL